MRQGTDGRDAVAMTSTSPGGPRRERRALNSIAIGVALALLVVGLVVVGSYALMFISMANYGSNK